MPDGSTLTTYDKDGNVSSKYTFTNDSKENKYGTVTDINGDKLDDREAIAKSEGEIVVAVFGSRPRLVIVSGHELK